jgi:double-stranded uracil-DNA glycosylase
MTEIIKSFPPVITHNAKILVLGSMPGELSLRLHQYYAHPRNLFWRLMDDLFGIPINAEYESRVRHLQQTGIGLWDTLMTCERPGGSLDTKILVASEVANDIPGLLDQIPSIEAICFNGRKAEYAFREHIFPSLSDSQRHSISLIDLPSTSPANASLTYAKKLERWQIILKYLPSLSTH